MGCALRVAPDTAVDRSIGGAPTDPSDIAMLRSSEPSMLAPGTTLPGGYTIREQIGSGGMGRVFAAEQRSLGRTVAVKIMHPHLCANKTARTRLSIEARAACRVRHHGSVEVLDFRETDHEAFLVMEHVEGIRLSDLLRRGPLSPRRSAGLVIQLLWALEEAHASGVLHRDVKPDNILVTCDRLGREHVKLVDYGLALIRDGKKVLGATVPGVMYGTPGYMSPEQAEGTRVDARTDVYSTGVVLHALLTRTLPTKGGGSASGTSLKPYEGTAPAVTRAPVPLATVLEDALQREPARRPSSAADFARKLTAAVALLQRERGARVFESETAAETVGGARRQTA